MFNSSNSCQNDRLVPRRPKSSRPILICYPALSLEASLLFAQRHKASCTMDDFPPALSSDGLLRCSSAFSRSNPWILVTGCHLWLFWSIGLGQIITDCKSTLRCAPPGMETGQVPRWTEWRRPRRCPLGAHRTTCLLWSLAPCRSLFRGRIRADGYSCRWKIQSQQLLIGGPRRRGYFRSWGLDGLLSAGAYTLLPQQVVGTKNVPRLRPSRPRSCRGRTWVHLQHTPERCRRGRWGHGQNTLGSAHRCRSQQGGRCSRDGVHWESIFPARRAACSCYCCLWGTHPLISSMLFFWLDRPGAWRGRPWRYCRCLATWLFRTNSWRWESVAWSPVPKNDRWTGQLSIACCNQSFSSPSSLLSARDTWSSASFKWQWSI